MRVLLLLRLPFLLLLAAAPFCLADVDFTSPQRGDSLRGGSTIRVEWEDSGEVPSIADLTSYSLFLCSGSNENPITLATLEEHGYFKNNHASVQIKVDVGASEPKNAYLLKMVSVGPVGTVTNFSPRFSLTDMTGTFSDEILASLQTVKDGQSPLEIRQVGPGAAPVGAPAAAVPPAGAAAPVGDFNMPFAQQDGPTRYCPMQKQPGKVITAEDAEPLFPTSRIPKIQTTFLPTPEAKTTVTQKATEVVKSRENDASPAPNPKDDMARFLARWKD
ncbi:MAG: hypothetical protein M1833_006068 [Piccolia ochrophora]|nr:MAG: hypothetical protein M1833_006068 [Piccolia ochrophora]